MEKVIVIVFCVGYLLIAMERVTRVNKAAVALLMAVVCWCLFLGDIGAGASEYAFMSHFGGISSIVFYLIGVMGVVGVIDRNGGFASISSVIRTRSTYLLLFRVTVITFLLSAVLDNMTTTIVMIMVLRELVVRPRQRMLFVGIVIIAANAGGAFSPIGDITTIMLWMNGNVTTLGIMKGLLLPSLCCAFVPMIMIMPFIGDLPEEQSRSLCQYKASAILPTRYRSMVLAIGFIGLLLVPVFRAVTGLPPFVGVMGVLAVLWIYSELAIRQNRVLFRHAAEIRVSEVLRRLDFDTVLFFMGILVAVAALDCTGVLLAAGGWLEEQVGNIYAVNMAVGMLSSVIDNVPLVAGTMSMYSVEAAMSASPYAQDGTFWQLLAFCAGTGGSMLIIGSVAGVVAMGLERISFGWYLRHFTFLAFTGFVSGIGVYWLLN